MIRGAAFVAALLALVLALMALAGCQPPTAEEIAAEKADYPAYGVGVFHDDTRAVTCWRESNRGGLSCLPDWLLVAPTVAPPSTCTGNRLCAGLEAKP